eukprot:10943737-Heterocapsa_arctica.AAC.1
MLGGYAPWPGSMTSLNFASPECSSHSGRAARPCLQISLCLDTAARLVHAEGIFRPGRRSAGCPPPS